jgi:hypothetical protein
MKFPQTKSKERKMRYCNLNRVCLLLLTLVILSCSGKVHAQSDNWSIIQLTNNSYYDQGPKIYGSNVVWYGYDGNDLEIFFYDGNTTTQLTNNSHHDGQPQVYGSNIVWQGGEGRDAEIFFYDGNTTSQLTDNTYDDYYPEVYGSNVVWMGYDGSDWEIFFYDGNTTSQLTNNSYYDRRPQIYGSNIIWQGDDGNDLEIFFYDGNTITQITDNSLHDASLQIHGSNVVWVGDDGNDEEIFLAKPVPPPVEAAMKLTPQMLNCNSKGKYVKAHLTLPEEFLPQDVDVNKPAWVEPMGIESESIKVLGAGAGPVRLEICFDREAFCDLLTDMNDGSLEVTVIGSLTAGRYFYATDTIKIKPQHQRITYRYKKNQHNQRPMKTLRPQRPRR